MDYKLGKTPARPDAVTFRLTRYLTTLPQPPATFGHESLLGTNIGMLGNDQYGDCVWAGAAHETMLWGDEANRTIAFTDASVLSDYSAVTGFNPADPASDKGTDMAVAASYRRKTGVLDGAGARHKVAAYLAITKGDLSQTLTAAWLFSAVGIGIEFPQSAMAQFNAGQPWDVVPGSKIEGGHYVPVVGYDGTNLVVITWGKLQLMTPAFFTTYNDESIAYLSLEMLTGGQSLEGFNAAQLQADLKAL